MRGLLLLSFLLPLVVKAADDINVALLDNQLPYSGFNVWNHPNGALPELLKALAAQSQLSFTPQPASTLAQLTQMLQERKVDMVLPPPLSSPPAGVLVSKPLLHQQWALITRNNHLILRHDHAVNLKQQRILLLRNSPVRPALTSRWPDAVIEEEKTLNDALKLLNAGAADGIVCDAALADMLIHNLYPGGLNSVVLPGINSSLRLWLAPGQEALLERINQSIDSLAGMPESIVARWLLSSALDNVNSNTNSDDDFLDTLVVISSILSLFLIAVLLSEILRRRRAERSLLDTLVYWQTLLNSIPTPLMVCNPSGKITHCNQALLESLQLTTEQVIDTMLEQFMDRHVMVPPIIHQDWVTTVSTLQPHFSDRTIMVRGKTTEIAQWLAVYSDSRTVPQGVLIGWYDISERKRLERELAISSQQAMDASREKSDFLARMSHEIRSPMNAILGVLELEQQKRPAPGSVLNIAYAASRQLLQIVGGVLDLSKIEAGEMQLQLQDCEIYPLLTLVVETHTQLAAQKGLRLDSDIEALWQCHYRLDSTRLTQILNNLLSNAIKYTEQGFVSLQVRRAPEAQGRDRLSFRISDSGQGIAMDMQENILQPYVQLDPTVPASTGLGLAICTQLLKLMGSVLDIQSVPGQGSHFSFTLLLENISQQPTAQTPFWQDTSEQPLSLLVVDDQPANLLVMKMQLETLGHQVTTCDDGKQAGKLLRHQRFDMVLTDCQMPVVTGYQLAQAQRDSETGRPSYQVIIGCTANAFDDEQRRCLEAGMDGVLIKPLTLQDLRQMLAEQQQITLDMSEIKHMAASQPEAIASILDALQLGSENDRLQLRQISPEEAKKYAAILHRQKGSFALAGFHAGVTLCQTMEKTLQLRDIPAIQLYGLQLNSLILRFIALLEQQRQ